MNSDLDQPILWDSTDQAGPPREVYGRCGAAQRIDGRRAHVVAAGPPWVSACYKDGLRNGRRGALLGRARDNPFWVAAMSARVAGRLSPSPSALTNERTATAAVAQHLLARPVAPRPPICNKVRCQAQSLNHSSDSCHDSSASEGKRRPGQYMSRSHNETAANTLDRRKILILGLNPLALAFLGGPPRRPSNLGVTRLGSLGLCPAADDCISTSEKLNDESKFVPSW